MLVSCSADKTLRLWRLQKTSSQSETLEGHEVRLSYFTNYDSSLTINLGTN